MNACSYILSSWVTVRAEEPRSAGLTARQPPRSPQRCRRWRRRAVSGSWPSSGSGRMRSASWPPRSGWSSRRCHTSCACCATSGSWSATGRESEIVYRLHDAHVGVLLAEAIFHVEHVRLGHRTGRRTSHDPPAARPAPTRSHGRPSPSCRRRARALARAGRPVDRALAGGNQGGFPVCSSRRVLPVAGRRTAATPSAVASSRHRPAAAPAIP